jgi:DNA ligase-1
MTWQRWTGIMKCYPFEEKRLAKWTPPFIIQPKYDGVRCRAIKLPNGGYLLLSSEENPIFSVPHINVALQEHSLADTELDGELYHHGWSFDQIVSITSRTVNLHPDHAKIQFHVFDYVAEEAQIERTTFMSHLNFQPPIINSPYWIASSLEEVMTIYDEIIAWGYEGIIVRNFAAPYVKKRSTYVMKFKPKKEDNYVIIGFEEGRERLRGNLGALVCASGDGNKFSVGTGFSDVLRKQLWNKRDSLAGRICKVQYQHITPGRKVPRFPVFMEVI